MCEVEPRRALVVERSFNSTLRHFETNSGMFMWLRKRLRDAKEIAHFLLLRKQLRIQTPTLGNGQLIRPDRCRLAAVERLAGR